MCAAHARRPALAGFTARDVMKTDLLTVSRNTPLSEVERLLGEHRIGGVPVTDEAGHIVGVVSVRDLLERYAQDPDSRPRRGRGSYRLSTEEMSDGGDLDSYDVPEESEETVADIMNSDVYSVAMDEPVSAVAKRMVDLKIHRILVADRNRYVGMITTFDLIAALVDT
jgi:CBS domain-containing protein